MLKQDDGAIIYVFLLYVLKFTKDQGKCIQHLIEHRKFCMLDEMLDAFERRQILRKMKKEEKSRVG